MASPLGSSPQEGSPAKRKTSTSRRAALVTNRSTRLELVSLGT